MTVADKRMKLELVGHTSLALLCLLGLCLYTFTYSLLYYGGKTHAVAVLEMWMLFSQLYVACVCGGIQLVATVFLGQGDCGVPRVGEVQSAAFLGIALAVTCIGTACVGGGVECAVYFPAAISGPLASAGAIAWSWVAFAASLSCENSLGIGGGSALIAASGMACALLMPPAALQTICGSGEGLSWASAVANNPASASNTNNWLLFCGPVLTCLGNVAATLFDAPMQGIIGVASGLLGAALIAADVGFVYSDCNANFRLCVGLLAVISLAGYAREV